MKLILKLVLLCLFASTVNAQIESNLNNNNSLMAAAGAISVTIGGDFAVNGTFPALITERVDQFVTRMYNEAKQKIEGKITDPQILQKMEEDLQSYSLRNITLKRVSGEEVHLDLLKFRITGDFANNPYLKNDDILIFPPSDLKRNFFSITGAVNNPGKFNYVEGDRLSDALLLARGINKAYENVSKVEINRLSYNGENLEKLVVDINNDIPIKRGDRIVVLADETQRKSFSVLVLGEVKRPGEIPVTKSNTTIRSVIKAAGGFTEAASLRRAKLLRGNNYLPLIEKEFNMNLEDQKDNIFLNKYPNSILFEYEKNRMLRMSNLTEEDTMFFVIDEQIRQMLNDATISFDSVLIENSDVGNLKMKDGDIIIVPQEKTTVYVYGQVAKPGNVKYEPGADYNYYIKQAGGLGEFADDSKIAVIKAESRDWYSVDEKKVALAPGDFIYIPKNPPRSFDYYVGKVGNYLGIVGSAATIILLLLQLTK